MNARDLMSAPVVSITPETTVHDIAELLIERHISGAPVVAKGEIVGMVTESDLLYRQEIGTDKEPPKPSWRALLFEVERRPADYVKSHARTAKDIMTRRVVTVTEEASAREIASIFATRAIRRVPVLRDGVLVGIVTRADLIRMLALTTRSRETSCTQSDEAIRSGLLRELAEQQWWRPEWSAVYVEDGIVHYRGFIESDAERQAARVAAENVPGVRGVEDARVRGIAWQPMF